MARSIGKEWQEPMEDHKYWIKCLAVGIVCIYALCYLFYRSVFMFPPLLLLLIPYLKWCKRRLLFNKQKRFRLQLRDFLQLLSGNLQAGDSLEHALHHCLPELMQQWGKQSFLYRDLDYMIHQIDVGGQTAQVLSQWGDKRADSELTLFLNVFLYAKKTGGDLCEIIAKTTDSISRRIDTNQQIDTILAAKRMEQRIMSVVPLGILLYITTSSPDYIAPLYGNLKGVIFMSGCLAVYAVAVYLGMRMLRIEVS